MRPPASILFATAAAALAGFAAQAATPELAEERIAREEERRIFQAPIAGIENKLWFNYLIEVTEAQKEVRSDLDRARDVDDIRDAWDEYAEELRDERDDYARKMAKRGYRAPSAAID